jgi:hypothetical protein
MNLIAKSKMSLSTCGPKRVAYKLLLIAPLFFFICLIAVVGADMIYSSGLYGGGSLKTSLLNFLGTLKDYTPQSVKVEGKEAYLLLGSILTLLLLFPRWVIKQYKK